MVIRLDGRVVQVYVAILQIYVTVYRNFVDVDY